MRRLLLAAGVLTAVLAAQSALPPLVPFPRQYQAQSGTLTLAGHVIVRVAEKSGPDYFAAETLAHELQTIEAVAVQIKHGDGGPIVLARADSSAGRKLLQRAGISLPGAANEEGYALIVTPKQAAVVASTPAGLFYGAQTLRQLFHPDGPGRATAPACTIVDWPALRWRGVQIDLSRGPISTLASIEQNLDLLAELKVNAYLMYFENTYDYPQFPVWAAPGGAITPDEARQIVAYAADRHITVIPEQEAFGHVHLGLQAERLQDLDELPYGGLLSPAAPGSLDFIAQMFAQLAPVFPGPFFHIGADETAELGTGRSAALQQTEGPGPLYLNYLKAIDARLAPYHRKILFWGDIAQAHPELLHELPRDMIAVPWVYSPEPSYDRFIKPFTDAGLETWVAPGVANWSRIFPDDNEAIPNIRDFIRDGRRLGATGVINTNWNDDGESFFDYAWYPLAFGAAASWEDTPDPARFQSAYDWAIYRADGHAFAGQIADMDAIHHLLQSAVHADGADRLMWHQAFSPNGQKIYGQMAPAAHQVRLLAEGVTASLLAHAADARRNRQLLAPVAFAARRFDFVGQKAIYAQLIAQLYTAAAADPANKHLANAMFGQVNGINGLLQDMRDRVSSLRSQYRALWLERNTPYFLDNILVRYDEELMYWQQQARRFTRLRAAYATTGLLPPLIAADPGN